MKLHTGSALKRKSKWRRWVCEDAKGAEKFFDTKGTKEHEGRSGNRTKLFHRKGRKERRESEKQKLTADIRGSAKSEQTLPQRTQRARRKNPERSFERRWMRRIGAQLNCRRSDQNEEMARRREMRQGNRWSIKNPSCHMSKRGAFG
jgi:hypothetical protein